MGEVAHATGPSLLGAPRFSEAWLWTMVMVNLNHGYD
jgi:hypothetical protein